MNRRTMLTGAGGVALLAGAGLFGWRAALGSAAGYNAYAARLRAPLPVNAGIADLVRYATLAANGHNTQPWQFIVIRDRERLKALSETGTYAQHLAGAAFAVVLVGIEKSLWNSFDLGQASSYLQLAAWDLGVGSCIATLHQEAAARELLGIPAESGMFLAISFGYPSPDFKPAQMGGRRSLDDVVRWETWEGSA